MKNVIRDLIKENFNKIQILLEGNDFKDITDALEGKTAYTSNVTFILFYLLTRNDDENVGPLRDTTGNVRELKEYLKGHYFKGITNSFVEALYSVRDLFNVDKFTSFSLIREQVNEYEKEYGWDVDDKFLFPENRLGNYALVVIHKLMNSNSIIKQIPNDKKRYKHIIENQIYVTDKKAINNFVFSTLIDSSDEFRKNIVTCDFLSDRFNGGKINFKATFCDPTYINENVVIKKRSNDYIYHKYVIKAINMSDVVNMLIPSRWLQNKTNELRQLINFRNNIKNSRHLKLINCLADEEIESDYLMYLIYDSHYTGDCYYKHNNINVDIVKHDIILVDGRYDTLINKVSEYEPLIKDNYFSSSWANIKTNDVRLTPERRRDYDIKVHVSTKKSKKGYLWIPMNYLNNRIPPGILNYKVFIFETATSAGKGFNTNFKIGLPGEICNQSFCGFVVQSMEEAQSLVSYLNTKFAEKLLIQRKNKNHINDETLKWLPSVPLDREWTDEKIFKYFKLNQSEKQLIHG